MTKILTIRQQIPSPHRTRKRDIHCPGRGIRVEPELVRDGRFAKIGFVAGGGLEGVVAG